MTRLGQNGDPKRCRTPTWIRAKKTWISCQIWEWVTCGNSKIPKSTSIWCLDVQCILDQGNPLEWAYFFCSLLVSDSKSLPKWILRSWKAGSILFFSPHPNPSYLIWLSHLMFFSRLVAVFSGSNHKNLGVTLSVQAPDQLVYTWPNWSLRSIEIHWEFSSTSWDLKMDFWPGPLMTMRASLFDSLFYQHAPLGFATS